MSKGTPQGKPGLLVADSRRSRIELPEEVRDVGCVAVWVFRSIVPTDSGPSRPPIPVYRAQFEGLTGITGHDTGISGHDTGISGHDTGMAGHDTGMMSYHAEMMLRI